MEGEISLLSLLYVREARCCLPSLTSRWWEHCAYAAFSNSAFMTISSFVSFSTSLGFVETNNDQNFIKKESVTHGIFTNTFSVFGKTNWLKITTNHHSLSQQMDIPPAFPLLASQWAELRHLPLSSLKVVTATELGSLLGFPCVSDYVKCVPKLKRFFFEF